MPSCIFPVLAGIPLHVQSCLIAFCQEEAVPMASPPPSPVAALTPQRISAGILSVAEGVCSVTGDIAIRWVQGPLVSP